MMASPARKKRIVITALIASSFLLLSAPSNPFILDDGTYGSQPLRLGMQPGVDEDLLSLIIADDYSADPRYKSEQAFCRRTRKMRSCQHFCAPQLIN